MFKWMGTQNYFSTRAAAFVLSLSASLAVAQSIPAELQPPSSEIPFLTVAARGHQIYTCREADGKFSWVFKAPEAALFDEHDKQVGRHYAGPSWSLPDGSTVTAKVTAHADAPHADSVPWLLLTTTSHTGTGTFTHVTHIQRMDTKGGAAPRQGCTASQKGRELRVPYTARYVFFQAGH